jgi:flagellar biosynthesis protein FlhG
MLVTNEMAAPDLIRIRRACAYLFSPELAKNKTFLRDLNLQDVKTAFRRKAKIYHPDFHRQEDRNMVKGREKRFIMIRESYETLRSRFEEAAPASSRTRGGTRLKKTIAIGGAKGGIGKSLFAANLGVFLSRKGGRTVLVDLDLGGANLHLYLGETFIKRNINDFLDRRAPDLESIMVKSQYGPWLIGGNSSQLGAANIGFSTKIRLLKAIRGINADYVIVDLGGDTTYNIIDFFLAADQGIVMTSCDPASYLDAYSFIKTALYRKLNRIFGSESRHPAPKDPALQKIIQEATMSKNGSKVKTVRELTERIKRTQPGSLRVVTEAISSYRPGLVMNKVTRDSNEREIVKRIQEASRKMLSIGVRHLGNFPYRQEIEFSARDLVPIVATHPKGGPARDRVALIARNLLGAEAATT